MRWEDTEEKLDFFRELKTRVHVNLYDGTFLNGLILRRADRNLVWIMQEDMLGEIFLFVKDIKRLREDKGVQNG